MLSADCMVSVIEELQVVEFHVLVKTPEIDKQNGFNSHKSEFIGFQCIQLF